MTFLEWCLEGQFDDRLLLITLSNGRVYEPGVAVPGYVFEQLKPLTLMEKPKLVNDIWHVKLEV